ncbi:MAG: O-antigen ligase family protein [Patescibacteria group bacterium]|nr:O-antigen ligase family protein [Patescibacteria group bacterium]
MKLVSVFDKIIRWGFYLLFLFVPLIFVGDTSELFEFNKMWLTFILTLVIGGAWISKMIVERRFLLKRTMLDIPIGLFLLSQIISTIFSMDRHISWWGYYSRFNGGLLSTITYIFLYYAFVTNVVKKYVNRMLLVTVSSGIITALWGLPSHFGYDPTCYLFRGTFDVACWTSAFQPQVRMFSTLGQPDWFGAYLSIVIPLALFYAFDSMWKKRWITTVFFALVSLLFYADLIFANSKSTFVAMIVGFVFMFAALIFNARRILTKFYGLWIAIVLLAVTTFIIGTPFAQLSKYSLAGMLPAPAPTQQKATSTATSASSPTANAITGEIGGTDSGKIRELVWRGAIEAWLHHPFFGTGVETFAFAYYQYRPAAHNLTSEWDYLYNKAHNEYLNYLATTGAFGLLTYLGIIGFFGYFAVKSFISFAGEDLFTIEEKNNRVKLSPHVGTFGLSLALVVAYLTILISNFFGFSVVIINVYFFMIPLFFLFLNNLISQPEQSAQTHEVNSGQWVGIIAVWLVAFYLVLVLLNYWQADRSYGLGYNLDRAGQYQNAYQPLHEAVAQRPDEPVFKDELAINAAVMATALAAQKDPASASSAGQLAQEAVNANTEITQEYPNDITYWKSRVRVMYTLSQINGQYLEPALEALLKANQLAPTDAKISYNLGLLYAQAGQLDAGVSTLQETVKLKPDYRDAYYALGLLLHQEAVDPKNQTRVINPEKQQQAVTTLHYILDTLHQDDAQVKEALKSWGAL